MLSSLPSGVNALKNNNPIHLNLGVYAYYSASLQKFVSGPHELMSTPSWPAGYSRFQKSFLDDQLLKLFLQTSYRTLCDIWLDLEANHTGHMDPFRFTHSSKITHDRMSKKLQIFPHLPYPPSPSNSLSLSNLPEITSKFFSTTGFPFVLVITFCVRHLHNVNHVNVSLEQISNCSLNINWNID